MGVKLFSSRLPQSLEPSAWANAVAHARSQGSVLDLTVSHAGRAQLELHSPDILQAFLDPAILQYEPAPAGMPSARAAIASHYAQMFARDFESERVFVTASTSESYSQLFALLADAGDQVLVPRPSYPLFETLARLSSVEAVGYPLHYNGEWALDLSAIDGICTEKTRAIVVVSPNNPTGSVLREGEYAALCELCLRRGLALIVDEVFAEYMFAPDRDDQVSTVAGDDRCLCFALGGLSKTSALPQLKLGWIVVGGPCALRGEAMARLEHISDAFLSASAPVQHALASLLDSPSSRDVRARINSRIAANYQYLANVIREHASAGVSLLSAQGGWTAVLQVPQTHEEHEWVLALLEQDQVLVQPGYFYDFVRDGYLVVSLLTPPDVLAIATQKIVERSAKWLNSG
jgi:aspartate/methionine/tyrosine aminotransferase